MPRSTRKTPLNTRQIQRLLKRHADLVATLASLGEISQGSVMPQPPRAWRWTRKVSGKTISLGLSEAQAHRMKRAIASHRVMEKTIAEMREITQKLILATPDPHAPRPTQNQPKPGLS